MEAPRTAVAAHGFPPQRRRGRVWLLLGCGLGIGGLLFWAVAVRDPVFSHPLTPRKPDPLIGLLAPPKAAPVVDTSPPEQLEIVWTNENRLCITFPDAGGPSGEDLYDYSLQTPGDPVPGTSRPA